MTICLNDLKPKRLVFFRRGNLFHQQLQGRLFGLVDLTYCTVCDLYDSQKKHQISNTPEFEGLVS